MNALVPLHFDSFDVRITGENGDPWFVLADVCKVLGIRNPSMVASALDEDERSKLNLGRQGETIIISEPALHIVILRSRQALTPGSIAYRFRRWLTHEVLPSIRKHGCYPPPPSTPSLPLDDEDLWGGQHKTIGERFREERLRWEAENELPLADIPSFSRSIIRAIEDDMGGVKKGKRLETLTLAGIDTLYILTGRRTMTGPERALRDSYRAAEPEQRRVMIAQIGGMLRLQ